MALFESYERRIDKITEVLKSYGINSIEEAEKITKDAGLDVYDQVKKIQPICFENACWAYTVGAAIAIKKGCRKAADAAAAIGEGLQAFCIPGSVADQRKVGLGHGNLGKMLLEEETDCFWDYSGLFPSYDRERKDAEAELRRRIVRMQSGELSRIGIGMTACGAPALKPILKELAASREFLRNIRHYCGCPAYILYGAYLDEAELLYQIEIE